MVQVTYTPQETFPKLLNYNNQEQLATFVGVDLTLAYAANMIIKLYDTETSDDAVYRVNASTWRDLPLTGDKTTTTFTVPIDLSELWNGTNGILFDVRIYWGYRIDSVSLVIDSNEAPDPEIGAQGFAIRKLSTIGSWIDTRLKVVDTGETVPAVPSGYTRILLGTFSSLDVYLEFKFYTW
jgi:hypothetical protein